MNESVLHEIKLKPITELAKESSKEPIKEVVKENPKHPFSDIHCRAPN